MSIEKNVSVENNQGIHQSEGTKTAMLSEKTFDDFLAQHMQIEHDYIDDDGFTAGVMANLPAPKKLNPLVEKLILGLPVLLIATLVLSHFPWREMVQPAYAILLTIDTESFIKIGVLLLASMFVATTIWGMKRLDII